MTNGPEAMIAEVVENPLPMERARDSIHREEDYYAVRNHLVDFLVSRSRTFKTEMPAGYDRRAPARGASRPPAEARAGAGQHHSLPRHRPCAGLTDLRPNSSGDHKKMKREQLTEKLLDIKREKGWTWKYICDEIGGMSPVLVVGTLLGQMKLVKPLAKKAADLFGLSEVEERMLNEVPMRGAGTPMPPHRSADLPLLQLVMVNGPAWKALIEEEFGDGIMSAIDFNMEMVREPNPKGDRVQITMSGKFLPYKYYGNEQGIPDYGFKESGAHPPLGQENPAGRPAGFFVSVEECRPIR